MADRFHPLLERVRNDEASDADLAELDALTRTDPELGSRLVAALQQEADLCSANRQPDLMSALKPAIAAERVRSGVMAQVNRSESARWQRKAGGRGRPRVPGLRQPRQGQSSSRRLVHKRPAPGATPWLVGVALAAAAVLVVLVLPSLRGGPASNGLRVVLSQAVQVDGRYTPAGDQMLPWGATIRSDGGDLRLADGSTVVLRGEVSIPRGPEAGVWRLLAGSVTCAVSPRSAGQPAWEVHTDHAQVVVVGTRFTVSVERDLTRVAVEHGRVRVADAQGVRVLSAGEEAVLSTQSAPGQPPPLHLYLVDPDDDETQRLLSDGDTIALSSMREGRMNIRVEAGEQVRSLRFTINGDPAQGVQRPGELEYVRPFHVHGDLTQSGTIYGAVPALGLYRLEAEIYADDAGETLLGRQSWRLHITE